MKKDFWIHKDKHRLLNLKNFKNNQSHAYLIFGPQDIGKLTYAYQIAKTFLCQKNKDLFCGKCNSCLLIEKERHPDLMVILPQGQKNPKILISQIKNLIKVSTSTSFLGGNKVFIIDQADKLTIAAQNALLKTLEEPDEKTLILLTSHSEKLVLPTILSRCQRVKLSSLSRDEIKNHLNKKLNPKQSDLISRYALGRSGLALKISDSQEIFDDILDKFQAIRKVIISQNYHYRFRKASEFASPDIQDQIINFFEIFFRDLLLLKIGTDEYLVNINLKKELIEISDKYEVFELLEIIKKIEKTKKSLLQNANPRLVFENLMLII